MTDEQIRELAARFADKAFADADMADYLTQEHKYDITMACIGFGNFLLETHCIVKKSKIKEWSDRAEFTAFDAIDLIEILDDIFGKDTFNEEKK